MHRILGERLPRGRAVSIEDVHDGRRRRPRPPHDGFEGRAGIHQFRKNQPLGRPAYPPPRPRKLGLEDEGSFAIGAFHPLLPDDESRAAVDEEGMA